MRSKAELRLLAVVERLDYSASCLNTASVDSTTLYTVDDSYLNIIYVKVVKLRQGSGKDRQGMALKAKGLKA